MVENEVTGRKYRILTDKEADEWDRISFWTSASDVYYDGNAGNAEVNRPINIIKRNRQYNVGDVAYVPTAPKTWSMFVCTKSGQTASIIPSNYENIDEIGSFVVDGTAYFTLYSVVPSSTISSSECQIPSMSLVNNLKQQLVTSDNVEFKFDHQNGTYGYVVGNTFYPFTGTRRLIQENWHSGTKNDYTLAANKLEINLSAFPDAIYWDAEHFELVPRQEKTTTTTSGTEASGSIQSVCSMYYGKTYDATTHTLTAFYFLSTQALQNSSGLGVKRIAIPVDVYYCG